MRLLFILGQYFCGGLSENPSVFFLLLRKVYPQRDKLILLILNNHRNFLLFLLFNHIAFCISSLFHNLLDLLRLVLLFRCINLRRNGFSLIHLDLFLQQILRSQLDLPHIIIRIILPEYNLHLLHFSLQFLFKAELLHFLHLHYLFACGFHCKSNGLLFFFAGELRFFDEGILHSYFLELASRKIGLLGPEEFFSRIHDLNLLGLRFVMVLDCRLTNSHKRTCTHQVATYFDIPIFSIIRKRRQLPGLHLSRLLLLPDLREGVLFNELKLIIGQLPAELLSLKPIDEL